MICSGWFSVDPLWVVVSLLPQNIPGRTIWLICVGINRLYPYDRTTWHIVFHIGDPTRIEQRIPSTDSDDNAIKATMIHPQTLTAAEAGDSITFAILVGQYGSLVNKYWRIISYSRHHDLPHLIWTCCCVSKQQLRDRCD